MRESDVAFAGDAGARARAWSRYWASGARHSCPGSFEDHYGPATQEFWRAQFRALGRQDRVLELGCGNGSLIRLLDDAGRESWPARVDGVDLATLDGAWLERLQPDLRARVRLHADTQASALPVADGEITRLFSQFAVEYFASEEVWKELARVLAPRAAIAAVVHHRDSHLCRLAQAEATDSAWLLAQDGPLDRAAGMLPWLALSADASSRARRDVDPRAVQARQRFNATYAVVGQRIATSPFPDLLRDAAERVMRILQAAPASGETAARQALEALRADLSDNRLRVTELVGCALDRRGIEAWAQRLSQAGFAAIAIGEIVEQGYLLGWSLAARRDG